MHIATRYGRLCVGFSFSRYPLRANEARSFCGDQPVAPSIRSGVEAAAATGSSSGGLAFCRINNVEAPTRAYTELRYRKSGHNAVS
jgi:hypothetical protein